MVELHLIAKGRVEGVFFRANAREVAIKLGLTGFVQNLPNGDVELIAQGEKKDLEVLISELEGLFNATFHPTYREPQASYSSFTIKR